MVTVRSTCSPGLTCSGTLEVAPFILSPLLKIIVYLVFQVQVPILRTRQTLLNTWSLVISVSSGIVTSDTNSAQLQRDTVPPPPELPPEPPPDEPEDPVGIIGLVAVTSGIGVNVGSGVNVGRGVNVGKGVLVATRVAAGGRGVGES